METSFGNTVTGRPPKPGRVYVVCIKLREGEHDAILERLRNLPRGYRSAYIRRVLSGAGIELLEESYRQESERLKGLLDEVWEDNGETI